ncbi:DUF4231 domain-containing protein [Amycolatopsis magusensis]|uniref:DUF4231 domain-containing protein n=1 Tax=Amycolatopsis magusensis TaxID=882444 RepID=UPI0024A940AB|nr:DUF4231 domain-containing protein [Amycolatopsis magusensis]MDI5977904.1 DUF4231 domain-containing protein [Amycolatopsis magusensis]
MTSTGKSLPSASLPGLFHVADSMSLRGQRDHLRGLRARLVLAILAAACGAFTVRVGPVDVMAVVTGVALLGILFLELHFRADSPEARWYDGRALAESAKSMGWRYAVGGLPFPLGADEAAVTRRFIDQTETLLKDGPTSDIPVPSRPSVSDAMCELRGSDLASRRAAYLADRIQEQRAWYEGQSETNDHHGRSARRILYVITAVGIVAAFARGFGFVSFDLAGVASALIAAAVAWSGAKQYATLARAYAYAAMELRIVEDRLMLETDEATWAAEVADAEEAVSREHTMWRASRTRATP